MRKPAALILLLFILALLAGCGTPPAVGEGARENAVPEDFSFALTWGAYGISSYDSKTGRLVKTDDATEPENYVTSHTLSDAEKAYIYETILALDIASYPEEYDPHRGVMSSPSMTLVLTVEMNGTEKTVRAEKICMSFESEDKQGQRFLSACRVISEMLMATPEWNALPDYEHYYL